MRLKSSIWVAALVRRVFSDGGFAAIVRRGQEDAGAIFIRIRRRDGEALLGPAPQTVFSAEDSGDRRFERRVEGLPDDIETALSSEVRFDPDLWVVEIETDRPEDYLDITPA